MTLQEFFQKTFPSEKEGILQRFHIRPRIVCNDGFDFSVQANEGAYCSPRYMIASGGYHEAEIGFPSIEEPLINEYAEDKGQWTETVYGWVPTYVIEEVIKKHGGINIEKTLHAKD